MNEDKIINKLYKYIKLKSKFTNTVFENVYGISIEQYIKNKLTNGQYWYDFEQGNYKIINPNGNRKKIIFKDGKTIDIYDWWNYGIGKLKKRLFDFNDKIEFLKAYCNFSGMEIKNKIIDEWFCKFYDKGMFYDVSFENCEFKDLLITDSNEIKGCYFNTCNFSNVQFSVSFLDNSYFNKCKFIECKDLHMESNSLEGEEWYELVNKKVTVDFIENTFYKCNLGFNVDRSLLYRNTFNFTNFEICDFLDSSFYYNEFRECNLENVTFQNSGKKNLNCDGIYDIFFCNKHIKCNFKNVNFTKALLLCHTFEENKYDNRTEFSTKYYNNFKDIEVNLSEEELECMNQKLDDMDTKGYLREHMNLYYNLFTEYKGTVMTKKAYEFYYIYKCLEKDLNRQLNLGEWFKSCGLYLSCGFGERPYRALIISLGIILFNSFLFLFFGIDNSKQPILYLGIYNNLDLNAIFPNGYIIKNVSFGEFASDYFTSLYFSIVSFATIGYGEYSPLTPWSRMLVCFQALASIILIALFTGTMVRKAFRD